MLKKINIIEGETLPLDNISIEGIDTLTAESTIKAEIYVNDSLQRFKQLDDIEGEVVDGVGKITIPSDVTANFTERTFVIVIVDADGIIAKQKIEVIVDKFPLASN